MVKFSITIPAYKSKYIEEAIASVLCQTYQNFELIIVDDHSPEDIKSKVNEFTDSRIHYYRNEKNCGAIDVVDNWNICLSHASGDYVICMGDDDMLLPNCLEEYCKLIAKYPSLGVYHGWTEIIDENSVSYDIQHPRPEYESVYSLIWNRWNGRNKQYIGDFCFDANLLKKTGGFYKLPMAWASDDITAVRAASIRGIANTQSICFQYRVNKLSITTLGSQREKIKSIIQEKKWYSNFISETNASELSHIDQLYFESLKNSFTKYFKNRIKVCVQKELDSSLFSVVWILKYRRMYGLSFSFVLLSLFKAIKFKIYK